MRKKKLPKTLYIIGVIWLCSIFGFPLFSLIRILLMFGISIGAIGFILAQIAKDSGRRGRDGRTVDTSSGTGSANPYSSHYRYTMDHGGPYGHKVTVEKNGKVIDVDPSQLSVPPEERYEQPTPEVKLSWWERRKLAKQAAREAALEKARAEQNAKLEAEKKEQEAKKLAEELKRQNEQSLSEKYNVPKRKRTGDSAIDRMLDDEEKAIAEMRRLDDAIEDPKVSAQIVHLEEVTTKIVDFVIAHPDKKAQVRRFFNYYLPTSIKLLNSYDRMDDTGISGTNIDGTKEQVELMMDKALESFDLQLDSLYADEAMDVTTEIKVMESLLSQEGLSDDITASQGH